MYKTFRVLIGFAALCLAHTTQAQLISNTPYSRYGLGEINENYGTVRNAGMAGAGISAANSYQPNTANPALLYYNSITNFTMGIAGQAKRVSSETSSQINGNGNLNNLSLSVPVTKRWSSAVGLRPFSTVNYQVNVTDGVEGNPQATIFREYVGNGGLSEAYFAHGFRVVGGLTVGASASYIFGNIANESSSTISDPEQANVGQERVTIVDRTSYNDFIFRAGANYRQKVTDKLFLGAGAVYSFESVLDAERKLTYERVTQPVSPVDSAQGSVTVPASLRAGISIDNGSNLTVAADFASYKWSDFKNFEGNNGGLEDSYRVAVGAEFTPDATAIDSYFKRIMYRGGLYYGETPYVLNGQRITDKGVTVGATLPIGRSTLYDLYQLNVSMGYGQRGTTDHGLVKEDYLQFGLEFTVNSRWFIKRRIE
ncbi:membrane protein [Pontibacter brevis]